MHRYIQKDYQGLISSSHNPQGLWTLLHNTPIPLAKRGGSSFHILTKNQSALSTCIVYGLGVGEQAEMDQDLRRKCQVSTLIIEVPRIDFWQINYQFGTSAPGMLIEYNKGLALLSPCHSSMFVAIQLIKFHTKRIIRKTYLPPPPHIKRKKKKKKKMEIFGLGGGIVG